MTVFTAEEWSGVIIIGLVLAAAIAYLILHNEANGDDE